MRNKQPKLKRGTKVLIENRMQVGNNSQSILGTIVRTFRPEQSGETTDYEIEYFDIVTSQKKAVMKTADQFKVATDEDLEVIAGHLESLANELRRAMAS